MAWWRRRPQVQPTGCRPHVSRIGSIKCRAQPGSRLQRSPAAGGAADLERAAERLDPIRQSSEAGSGAPVGAADAVARDVDEDEPIAHGNRVKRAPGRTINPNVRKIAVFAFASYDLSHGQ
jgi:hypothetical protein